MNKIAGMALIVIGILMTQYESDYMVDLRKRMSKKMQKMENQWDNM